MTRTFADMTHAKHLRGMASDERILAGRENARSTALLAGADALEARVRVRHALGNIARVKADSEAARDHGYDNPEWHETTADALEYVIDLLTEVLERDTK